MTLPGRELIAIIVTYQSELLIQRCIEAAVASGVDRILIWDNSPDERTQDLVESLQSPVVQMFSDGTNHGFGGGVNRALHFLESDCTVLLLNPDCIVSSECVLALRAQVSDPGVGLVAPRMKYADGSSGFAGGPRPSMAKEVLAATRFDDFLPPNLRTRLIKAFGRITGAGSSYSDSCTPGLPVELFWVSGFCIMVRASVLRAIGGFDEDFFLYFEDVDLSIRVRQQGLRVVLERRAEALHFESASTKLIGKSNSYRDGRRVFFDKHGSQSQRLAIRLGW